MLQWLTLHLITETGVYGLLNLKKVRKQDDKEVVVDLGGVKERIWVNMDTNILNKILKELIYV